MVRVGSLMLDNRSRYFYARFDGNEFFCREQAGICKPMAVRAKDNTIGKRELAAICFRNDMMCITTGSVPPASHTGVGIESPHGLIPCSPISVHLADTKHVGFSFVPGAYLKRLSDISAGCRSLRLRSPPVVMPRNVSPMTTTTIDFRNKRSASAPARYVFHSRPHHWLIRSVYNKQLTMANSVVPAMAEYVGRCIIAAEATACSKEMD